MGKFPSPCIDVCKFKIKGGHCIGCSMTKAQKSMYKNLGSSKEQKAFIDMLMSQQAQVGSARTWAQEYTRKCQKRGATAPFELAKG